MDDITRHIRERLPRHKVSIDLLAGKDSGFSTLCDDYDACVDALRYWQGSEEPGANTRVREYRDLIAVLYEEITEVLEQCKKRRPDGGLH